MSKDLNENEKHMAVVIGPPFGAAAIDGRIKAIVTSAMYDISGFDNNADNETWQNTVADLAKTRWEDVDNGYPGYKAAYEKAKIESSLKENLR